MPTFFQVFLLFNTLLAFSQKPDKTTLEFLNWFQENGVRYSFDESFINRIRKPKVHAKIIPWDSSDFIIPEQGPNYELEYSLIYLMKKNSVADSFSIADKLNFLHQLKTSKIKQWSNKTLNRSRVAYVDKIKKDIYSYSLPIFNLEKNIALIRVSFYCGSLCGHGGVYVYQKGNDGNWKLLDVINSWVS